MAPRLVIKVQHDGTLRRFNATIKKNGELDLDMVALKTKLFSLFNIPADADLKLTYVDEDGDVVTLVDDDDLSDVTWQSLAFFRINVALSNGRVANPHARSMLKSMESVSGAVSEHVLSLSKSISRVGNAIFFYVERLPLSTLMQFLTTMTLVGFLLLIIFLLPDAYGFSILTLSRTIIVTALLVIIVVRVFGISDDC